MPEEKQLMIVYNVTMKVDWTIEEEWLQWMNKIYIPAIIDTGYFHQHQFVRLLEIDETDGPTYAVQYYSTSLNNYNNYVKEFAPVFSNVLQKHWGDKCLAFGTLMELIH